MNIKTNDTLEIRGSLLARNTFFNLVGHGMPIIVAIVTMPYVIRGLGVNRFGILALGWAFIGHFSILEFGITRAATKYIAEILGTGEYNRMPRIVWTSIIAQAVLGIIGGLVLYTVIPVFVARLLNVPEGMFEEACVSFRIMAFSIPLLLVSGALRAILEAFQRFDLVNLVKLPFSIANYLLPLLGILLSMQLPGIVLLLVASRIVAFIVYYLISMRLVPSLKGLPRCSRGEFSVLLRFGSWVTVSNVFKPILMYLDRFMIGAILTVSAVAYYTAPYEIVTRLWVVPASFALTVFPAFSTLANRDGGELLREYFLRAVKYICLVIGPLVVIVVACSYDILHLWLGGDFGQKSAGVLQVLAIGVLFNSLAYMPYSFLQALGRPDLTAKIHLIELPFYALLTWVFINAWGTVGAALAWSLRVMVDAAFLFLVCARLTSLKLHSFLTARIPHIVLYFTIVTLVIFVITGIEPSMPLRFGFILVTLSIAFIIVWRRIFDSVDRRFVVKLFRTFFR